MRKTYLPPHQYQHMPQTPTPLPQCFHKRILFHIFSFHQLFLIPLSIVVQLLLFSIMLLKENSLGGSLRGQSVDPKKSYTSGLRSMVPKFLRDIGDKPDDRRKNNQDGTTSKITILTKQNIKPQFTLLQQKSYIPFTVVKKLPEIGLEIVPRGLHNIGNTCYMNSTLQCLFHLKHFTKALVAEVAGWPSDEKSSHRVANQLTLAVKEMAVKGAPLNLGALKKGLGRKKTMFLGNAQQDAQEYLTNLLQILNEQLSRVKKKCPYKELEGDPTKKSIIEISNEWWDYYQHIDNSIVCDTFQGQTISTIKCRKCQKQSVNFDNEWGMPITFHRNKSVYELLINGGKSESLVEDFYCSGCKKQRDCSKVTELFRLPKVLVIQLKRFQYQYGQKRKRKQQVKIDLEIDVSKIMNEHAMSSQSRRYKLKGVVHHHGQAEYGHYYAQVFCDSLGKWYCLNDSSVDEISFSCNSKSAYLLFYEQVC